MVNQLREDPLSFITYLRKSWEDAESSILRKKYEVTISELKKLVNSGLPELKPLVWRDGLYRAA